MNIIIKYAETPDKLTSVAFENVGSPRVFLNAFLQIVDLEDKLKCLIPLGRIVRVDIEDNNVQLIRN